MMPFVIQVHNALERIDALNRDSQFGLERAMHDPANTITLFSIPTFSDRDALQDLSAVVDRPLAGS